MPFALLAKDLTERAARRRTYVVRSLFGLLLAGWFWWFMHQQSAEANALGETASPGFQMLGMGRNLFRSLSTWLCWAVLLIQPVLMAPAFTYEKERGTFELLLLTAMRLWSLVAQKFLAGLIPMANLLVFALPLAAVAYSYGGMSMEVLGATGLVLLGAWLLAAAAGLFCSAWFRTLPAAIIGCYALLALVFLAENPGVFSSLWSRASTRHFQYAPGEYPDLNEWRSSLQTSFPPTMIQNIYGHAPEYVLVGGAITYFNPSPEDARGARFWMTRTGSGLTVGLYWMGLSIAILIVGARVVLIRRSQAPPRRLGKRFLARLDRFFESLNRRFGGASFGRNRTDTLANHPIRWREYTTGILGRPQYLVRIGLVLTVASTVVLLCDMSAGETILHALAILCGLIILVRSVDAIGGERQRQTLEVLLSTPVPRRDIILHKAAAVTWLSVALMVPVALIFVGHDFSDPAGHIQLDVQTFGDKTFYVSGAIALCSLLIAFREIRWLGMWCGIANRSRAKATSIALAVGLAWILLPNFLALLWVEFAGTPFGNYLRLVPPDGLFTLTSRGAVSAMATFSGSAVTAPVVLESAALVLVFHYLVASILRGLCLRQAEHRLLQV